MIFKYLSKVFPFNVKLPIFDSKIYIVKNSYKRLLQMSKQSKQINQTYDILYIFLWILFFVRIISKLITKKNIHVKICKIELKLLILIINILAYLYIWINIKYHEFQEHCRMIEDYHIH